MNLKEMLKGKIEEQKNLLNVAIQESRGLTEDEQVKVDNIEKEIVNLEKTIETQTKIADRTKDLNTATSEPIYATPKSAPKKFESLGEQLMCVAKASVSDGYKDQRLFQNASGLSEGVPADGGFLVQQDFVSELLKKTYENGILANAVRKIPLSTNSNGLKINAVDEKSRATGSRMGGIQGYWLKEAGTKTASKPKFRQIELELNKLIGLCYATDELLQDTTALETIIQQEFPSEFSFLTDDAIFRGDGIGKPLGMLNSGALISVAKESGQVADTVVYENLIKMWSRLWARSRSNAVWLVNQEVEPQLDMLALSAGTGALEPRFISYDQEGVMRIKGRPVIPFEQSSALGDVGDIALVDPTEYLMIDKDGVKADTSIHVKFLEDETAFRFVYRCDGQPVWNAPLTPYKGSSTISPFIALAERA